MSSLLAVDADIPDRGKDCRICFYGQAQCARLDYTSSKICHTS